VHHIVSTKIKFYFLESDLFQVLLSKNPFPGSRDFPGNGLFIPAFPGMAKWLSRGNTTPDGGLHRLLGPHSSLNGEMNRINDKKAEYLVS
jgi:hypothetical protein